MSPRFLPLLLACGGCSGDKSDSGPPGWGAGTCPQAEFRALCNDPSSMEDGSASTIREHCEGAMPATDCSADEQCVDATCLPAYADNSAACTAAPAPIDTDLTTRLRDVSTERCDGERQGEGVSSNVSISRRGDGTLEFFYGSKYDAGTTAPCFPTELAGLEIDETDCVLQPRVGWEDVWHNIAVSHPQLPAPLHTGESAVLTLGTETYTITVGVADEVLLYGPNAEGDQMPEVRVEVLVMRDGYTFPGE